MENSTVISVSKFGPGIKTQTIACAAAACESGREKEQKRKLGRSGEGASKKGEGVGRKGIACRNSQTYRTLFTHERGAIVQFDWFWACRSKYDITNLSLMHNPTSGTQQDQNRDHQVRRTVWRGLQIFCSGNVNRPFAKRQTNRSKTRARSCHRSLARKQNVVAIHLSNTRRRLHGYRWYLHVTSQICFKDMF